MHLTTLPCLLYIIFLKKKLENVTRNFRKILLKKLKILQL